MLPLETLICSPSTQTQANRILGPGFVELFRLIEMPGWIQDLVNWLIFLCVSG